MKKIPTQVLSREYSLARKVYLMSKITVLLLLAFLEVSASGYSQNTFTLNFHKTRIERILHYLEKHSDYVFYYTNDELEALPSVDLHLKDITLSELLDSLSRRLGIGYQILDNKLVVLGTHVQPVQDHRITGRVTDTTGKPLAGVTVRVKGKQMGTVTDADGRFSLVVPDDAVLEFSAIGYNRVEVPVGDRQSITVNMHEISSALNELVVVGYGTEKKATLTGSISSVKGSDIVKSPAVNVSNSLVGRLPGLTAVQGSGEPGYDGSTIRIRGINSFNNNDPLVVVDGIPYRSLERIDPNSIESITILKDASAAIYGSEAANGVILITTKRGRVGKPQIGLNLNYGYNQPTRLPKMADAATYATMLNEIADYAGTPEPYSAQDIQKFKDGSDPWQHPNTDWFKEVLKKWSDQYAGDISVSGGTESMRYYVLVGTRFEDGNYRRSATFYRQDNFMANLDAHVNKNVHIGVDLSGREEYRHFPTRGAGEIFRFVMRGKPTMNAYWPNGLPGPDIEYGDNPAVIVTSATGYDKDLRYYLNSNLHLDINIPWIKGLSITGNAAFDKGFQFRKLWQTPWYLYTLQGFDSAGNPILIKGQRGYDKPQLTEWAADNTTITLNALLNYEHRFGVNHDFKFMVGTESIKGYGNNFNAFRRFNSTAIDQLFAGLQDAYLNNGGSGYINARLNYFGRVNYSYKEKYLLEFVWRYDGSYIFPENHRFGFFPGVSAGWRISQENFWQKALPFINDFKLRASYGQTGNDRIDEWQYLATYSLGNWFNGNYGYGSLSLSYYPFVTNGNVENQTLYESRIPNPDVTWERANQTDVGFDATLLKSKLAVTFDYFSYIRSKILWYRNASVPLSTGLALPRENIGKAGNRGFDFAVNYQDQAGKFHYQLGVNGGYARNRVIYWDEPPGAPKYQQTTGHPFPSSGLYYVAIGVFHNQAEIDKYPHWAGARPGDIIFKDVNGDGKIDGNDRVRSYKNNVPRFTGGFTAQLQYGPFDLSILLQGAAGAENYVFTESGEIGNFLESFAEGRWTPSNPDANKPRTFNRSNEYWASQANTYFLHSTDYLRLKNLEIGYSLPAHALQRMGFQQFRIYVSGYNLLTYSPHYKDFDPEASAGSGQSYPLQRVVNLGLNASF